MVVVEKFLRKVVTAPPTATLAAVARLMEQHGVGAVVIAENQKPVGIVTDRDLALELGARGTRLETPVVKVMTTPVETASLADGVFAITQSMCEYKVRRLPVVDDDGRLAGIVTLDDLLRLLTGEFSNLLGSIEPEMEVKV